MVGFGTHVATSMLMGVIGNPFVAALSQWRTMLAALAYALASYPVVVAFVMTWANPAFVERTDMVAMTIGHAVFGLTYGVAYLALVRSAIPYREVDQQKHASSRRSGQY